MRWPFDGDGFPYGYFACVMATGIVSIGARLEGLIWVSTGLFILNLAQFSFWGAALVVHLCIKPATGTAELLSSRGPESLTLVAALCVLGNEIGLATAYHAVVRIFCIAAVFLWVGIIYAFAVQATIRAQKPRFQNTVDGSWLLVVVATEGIAILIMQTIAAPALSAMGLFAALCLFLLGTAFYAVLIVLIVARWIFLPLRPEQLTPPYWINMGAAAIATLAGSHLLAESGRPLSIPQFHEAVLGATILLWTVASWWIPLLAALTLWRHYRGVRLAYRIDNWAMVFPLGMYTVASWHLSHDAGLSFLAPIPNVFVWIALGAWGLTFTGMIRSWAAANRTEFSRDATRPVR